MHETLTTTGPMDATTTSRRPTHYCETCEEQLAIIVEYDDVDDDRGVQCNNCGGWNTRELTEGDR